MILGSRTRYVKPVPQPSALLYRACSDLLRQEAAHGLRPYLGPRRRPAPAVEAEGRPLLLTDGLLGGRGEEAVRGERGLRDAEQDRVKGGWLALLLFDHGVLGEDRELVGHLLGEELRVARVVDDDLAQHLADYHLDVFVVYVHALGPVDL